MVIAMVMSTIKIQKRKKFIKTYCTYRGRVYCRYFVFFISIIRSNSYFVYYNFDVSFDWYTHFNRVDSFTIHLLKHQIASYLLEEARERKHARTQSIRCCTFLRSCFLFIAIHCDLFAKFCLFGLFFFDFNLDIASTCSPHPHRVSSNEILLYGN